MNKKFVVGIFLIFLCLIYYFIFREPVPSKVHPTDKKVEAVEKSKRNSDFRKECQELIQFVQTNRSNKENKLLWNNVHILYEDGFTYRVRFFYDDGPNGEYKKTVLYKEDDSGFPHIIKVYRGFVRSDLKRFFDNGKVIWKESAFKNENHEIFWRSINNKIVELSKANIKKCLF